MVRVDLAAKERLDLRAWLDSPTENPNADSPENLVNKLGSAAVFLEALEHHRGHFERATRILEIGAGQCWAACIVRKRFDAPEMVLASDLSWAAVAGASQWERVFATRLEGTLAHR